MGLSGLPTARTVRRPVGVSPPLAARAAAVARLPLPPLLLGGLALLLALRLELLALSHLRLALLALRALRLELLALRALSLELLALGHLRLALLALGKLLLALD